MDSTPHMEDGGCSLTYAKVTNPNIIKVAAKSPCIYSPTKLKRLYHQIEATNRCPIEETNRFSLIYLNVDGEAKFEHRGN